MAKSEWGAKHVCVNCGLKYYDMQRSPVGCPSCGEKAAVAATRTRRGRNAAKPESKAPNAAQAVVGAVVADADDDGDAAAGAGLLVDDDNADIVAKEIVVGGVEVNDKEA